MNKVNLAIWKIILPIILITIVLSIFVTNSLPHSIFCAITLFLTPILVGSTILKITQINMEELTKLFLIGALIIFFIGCGLAIFNQFNIITLSVITIFLSLIGLYKNKNSKLEFNLNTSKYFIFALGLGISIAILFRAFSQFPKQYGYDIFMHNFIILNIQQNIFYPLAIQFSNNLLLNAYSSIFHLLLAVVSTITQIDSINLFWAGIFVSIPIFAAGIFILSKELFKKNNIALLSTGIGLFSIQFIGESNHLYLIPASIIIILIPIIYYSLIKEKPYKKSNLTLIIALISLMTFHFFLGGLVLLSAIVYLIFLKFNLFNYKKTLIAIVLLITLIIFFIPAEFNLINLPDSTEKNYPIEQKISFLVDWYGLPITILCLIGFIYIFIYRPKDIFELGLINYIFFIIFLIPLSFTYRAQILFHVFLSIISAAMLIKLLNHNQILEKVCSILTIIIIVYLFLTSISTYTNTRINWSNESEILTAYSDNDLVASQFIKSNTLKETILLDNRIESNLYSGLSGRDYLNYYLYTDKIFSIFDSTSSKETNTELTQLTDCNKILIIYSGRANYWTNIRKETEKMFVPQTLNKNLKLEKFFDENYFTILLNQNDQIFLIKPLCKTT